MVIKDEVKPLVLPGDHMRSDLVFNAMKQVSNRFLLTAVLAKATRKFHRPGTRIEDTTSHLLVRCGRANPIAEGDALPTAQNIPATRTRQRAATTRQTRRLNVPPVLESPHSLQEA